MRFIFLMGRWSGLSINTANGPTWRFPDAVGCRGVLNFLNYFLVMNVTNSIGPVRLKTTLDSQNRTLTIEKIDQILQQTLAAPNVLLRNFQKPQLLRS